MNETDLRKKITGLFGHIEVSRQLKEFGTIKQTEIDIRQHAFDVTLIVENKTLLVVYLEDLNKFSKFVYELFETRAQLKAQFLKESDMLIIPNTHKELKFIFYFRR